MSRGKFIKKIKFETEWKMKQFIISQISVCFFEKKREIGTLYQICFETKWKVKHLSIFFINIIFKLL